MNATGAVAGSFGAGVTVDVLVFLQEVYNKKDPKKKGIIPETILFIIIMFFMLQNYNLHIPISSPNVNKSITAVQKPNILTNFEAWKHSAMNKVLIIEDDIHIVELLKIHLADLSCEITSTQDGKEALELASKNPFDLLILDLMLPGINGMEICRRVRMSGNTTPIIILSAKSEEIDKILGLETGADDYLTKPFSIREFVARVKVIFRRKEEAKEEVNRLNKAQTKFGDLEIDMDKRKVTLNNSRVELSPKEFELLILLASNPGKSYSRKRLLNLVWGYDFDGYEHTVNSHINRLRGKIETSISNPKYILTTWGVGYRFNEEL
jgi:DNA-binding response OmpR family regulator